MPETPEQALDLCVDEVRTFALPAIDEALIQDLKDRSIELFRNNHAKWPANRDKVLLSASYLGAISTVFAKHNGHTDKVHQDDLEAALTIVRDVCPARAKHAGNNSALFAWCPSGRSTVKR